MKYMSPTSWNGASHVNVKLFMRTGFGALTTADDDRSLQLRNMAVLGAPTKRPTPACGNLLVGPPPSALLIFMQILCLSHQHIYIFFFFSNYIVVVKNGYEPSLHDERFEILTTFQSHYWPKKKQTRQTEHHHNNNQNFQMIFTPSYKNVVVQTRLSVMSFNAFI